MSKELERLIADLCNADKREQDKKLKQIANKIIVANVDSWYREFVKN